MVDRYVLKTDRNAQWQKLENLLSETATKKQIKVCRDYFLHGIDNSKHFTWLDRFREILQNPPQCLVHVSMQWHPHRP